MGNTMVDFIKEVADAEFGWEDEEGTPLANYATRFLLDMKRIHALCCAFVDAYEIKLTANEKALLEAYYKLFHE